MERQPVEPGPAEGPPAGGASGAAATQALVDFLGRHRRVVVISGAGCSAPSGLPPYRDADGAWQHPRPMLFTDFLASDAMRRRYWYRSMAGWPRFAAARPNGAHRALAALESAGFVRQVITQNVDGLHQAAGSRAVVDLHGRLDRVRCLDCGGVLARAGLQAELARHHGAPSAGTPSAPDGDAPLDSTPAGFPVPHCPACGGLLKPDVVFFGEAVPVPVTAAANAALADADALLVVGSSLMVFSGFRLVRDAARAGLPVAALTLGRTRADEYIGLRLVADCSKALPAVAAGLGLHGVLVAAP